MSRGDDDEARKALSSKKSRQRKAIIDEIKEVREYIETQMQIGLMKQFPDPDRLKKMESEFARQTKYPKHKWEKFFGKTAPAIKSVNNAIKKCGEKVDEVLEILETLHTHTWQWRK